MDNTIQEKNESPVISVLQDIRNGVIDPLSIDKPTRKEVVSILRAEGHTIATIAQILNRNDKTIKRDIDEIKKDNQVVSSPEFVKETIGEMFRVATNHWSSLLRIARSSTASTSEKIYAEISAWTVMKELIEQLRRVGYLPSAAQEVIGTFSHKIDDCRDQSWDEIEAEVIELKTIAQETKVLTPVLEMELLELGQRIDKAKIKEKIKLISSDQGLSKEGESHE